KLVDGPRDIDTALAEQEKQIADAIDGDDFYEEILGALDYHEKIVKATSRLHSAINARAPVGSTVIETNQQRQAGTSDASSNFMGAAHSDTTGQNLANHCRPRALALVVTGRVERFSDTLWAPETIFGWGIQGVCANVNHHSSPRNISTTALFLACSDDWCTEVLPGDPLEIWRLEAIGITDGQDDVSNTPSTPPLSYHSKQECRMLRGTADDEDARSHVFYEPKCG
ncbi:hypothetical protein MTO96_039069, partial [Rhipicephalus appendiculatus]